jgi:hypothetical protein
MNTKMQHALGGPQDTVPFVSENRRAPDRWFAATTSWDPVRNLPDGRAAYLNGGTAIWHSFVWTFYFTVLNNLGSTQVVKDKTVNVGATFCTVLWSPLGPNVLSRSGWLGWAKKRKEGKKEAPTVCWSSSVSVTRTMNTFKKEVIAKLAGQKGKFGCALSAFYIISQVPYQVYLCFRQSTSFWDCLLCARLGLSAWQRGSKSDLVLRMRFWPSKHMPRNFETAIYLWESQSKISCLVISLK